MRSIPEKYRYTHPGERSPSLFFPAFVLAIFVVFCVCMTGVADADGQAADITDPAHSNKADPDYSIVFPDDRVNTMTITISPENWETMLANMTELYGDFGGGSQVNPGQGGAPGGMMSSVDPVYVPADISFNSLEWPDVGIRFKGFNSLQGSWHEGSYKISLKLNFDKFENEYPEIKNQRFYGFDELNLQSAYNDDSLMRDMVVPSIFRESGVPAPHTAFYRLFVDYGEGSVYFGLYTMIEAVEDTVIETQFTDDSGNLYKPEGTGATFAKGTFNTDAFEKKTNEDDADWSDVEELYTVLQSDTRLTNPEEWREELESIFDVDEFLRWLATNTAIQNWDTYGVNCRNFYLYTDPADGKITWIPWDNNYALSSGMPGGNHGDLPAEGSDFPAGNRTAVRPGAPAVTTGNTALPSAQELLIQQGAATTPSALRPGSADLVAMVRNGTLQAGVDLTVPGMPAAAPPEGNQAPGNVENGARGGMGRTLSLSLDEAGDTWPLIRYMADDPVYYERYREYLAMVVTTSFEPARMEETYRSYHTLIEPYVTGPEGEQEGYTNLLSPDAFDASLDELIEHVNSRHDAVVEFLSGIATPAPTPTPTPAAVRDTVAPVVTIIAPALYSTATAGGTIVISWSAADTTEVAEVFITYSPDQGSTWIRAADDLPAAGTYSLAVPPDAGPVLTVKVTAADTAGNTGSAIRILRIAQTPARPDLSTPAGMSIAIPTDDSLEWIRADIRNATQSGSDLAGFVTTKRTSLSSAELIQQARERSNRPSFQEMLPG